MGFSCVNCKKAKRNFSWLEPRETTSFRTKREGREVFKENRDWDLRSPGEIHSQRSKWVKCPHATKMS